MSLVSFNTSDIISACRLEDFTVTGHARQRFGQRCIIAIDVIRAMVNDCEIVEHQPHINPGPRAVVLTHLPSGKAIHTVCCVHDSGKLEIVTVYEPTPPKWDDERTRTQP